jgi:hypothetical protein
MTEINPILNACGFAHDLAVVGSRQLTDTTPIMSVVLYRCRKCGLHSSALHHGQWELADFVRDESEIEELRRTAK